MRAVIDTMFAPLLQWLQSIIDTIGSLSLPVAQSLDISKYFGYFGLFGAGWQYFIQTVVTLSFIYGISYLIVVQMGLLSRFKDLIKWW